MAEKKDYEGAVKALKKAGELIPDRARIFYNLGLIEQFLQRNSDAEASLSKAITIEPQNFDYYYALADHFIKTNQKEKALTLAKEIIKKFPSNQLGGQIIDYFNKTK